MFLARTAAGLLVVLLLAAVLLVTVSADVSDLVISELLASNDAGLQDEDGDYSDWLEIHNTGASSVDLAGLLLTDDAEEPNKWAFPSGISLEADAYLVVFASDKDRTSPTSELHTNFKLGAGGEYLGLYADETSIIAEYSPEFPPQSADRSYGIDSNGLLRFFSSPTPGEPNGVGDKIMAEGVAASFDRGFYSETFSVALESTQPDARILFTTDGSEPTDTSGILYESPIAISTTTVLRAATFAEFYLPSATSTYSYVFLVDVIQQPAESPGFPNGAVRATAFNNPVPLDMAMDSDVVMDYADEILDSMMAMPTMVIATDLDKIFGDEGFYFTDDIEHKTSMEILDAKDPSKNEQIDVGVESHSSDRLKRSLRLNFRSDYGNRVNHRLL